MNTVNWLQIFEKYNTQETITGKVLKKIPGGLTVNVYGTEAFLPWSQVSQNLKDMGENIIDTDINFKLLKINAFGNNIVVSRIEILEQEKEDAYQEAVKNIHVGDIYDAVVKNVVPYGVFVTINNKIDGLIPSKELSWQFINDNNQVVSINDTIKVKVIDVDEDTHKISLSHKECVPSPWEAIDSTIYYRNAILDVHVSRVIEHGVIVALKNGCQGMLPSKEVSWDETEPNLNSMFKIGEKLRVKLLSIDPENRRCFVSLKQIHNKPANFIPVGKRLYCTIDHETKEGLHLLANKNIPVFLPKTEISWLKNYDLNKYMNRAGKLQVIVIDIAHGEKPTIVSIKKMYPDPMNAYIPNSIHKGYVSGESAKVYFVNFADGLTGLILKESLHGQKLNRRAEIRTKVISSDKENRRIILELHRESEFTGNDIMEMLNLKPSKVVGILKKMLTEAVVNGEIDSSYNEGAQYVKEKAKQLGIV